MACSTPRSRPRTASARHSSSVHSPSETEKASESREPGGRSRAGSRGSRPAAEAAAASRASSCRSLREPTDRVNSAARVAVSRLPGPTKALISASAVAWSSGERSKRAAAPSSQRSTTACALPLEGSASTASSTRADPVKMARAITSSEAESRAWASSTTISTGSAPGSVAPVNSGSSRSSAGRLERSERRPERAFARADDHGSSWPLAKESDHFGGEEALTRTQGPGEHHAPLAPQVGSHLLDPLVHADHRRPVLV